MTDTAVSPELAAETTEYREAEWQLKSIRLAGITWNESSRAAPGSPVLMVHGWLDNALTFIKLAPELARSSAVTALDLAGHGKSGHRPAGQSYLLMDYVSDLAELVETHVLLDEEAQVDLVGHSLGGIVCALYAAAFPERVRKLVMIDSLGAMSRPVDQTIPQLRRAIKKRLAGSGRHTVYPDVETAAKAREGGLSPLSPEAALTLTPRNMKSVQGGVIWRTDSLLRHPTPLMMSEEQVQASLEAIVTPTLFVRAQSGLLANHGGLDKRSEAIKELQVVNVPGGHHCHLDGNTRPVTEAIRHFLHDD